MIKNLKTFVYGICILALVFTFMPTGTSTADLMSFQRDMSIGTQYSKSQSTGLVSELDAFLSSKDAKDTQTPKVNGTFPETKQGVASGLWGTSEDLYRMISNFDGGRGLTESQILEAYKFIGVKPEKEHSYENNPEGTTDRFQGSDGYGFVRYSQDSSEEKAWNTLPSGSDDYMHNACGLINVANALSTLSKRWVHPMELMIPMACLNQMEGHRSTTSFVDAFCEDALADACVWAGFTQTTCQDWGTEFTKENVDACLDAGGIVVAVFKVQPFTSAKYADFVKAHYVCIRQRVDCTTCGGEGNHCYLVSNSCEGREDEYPKDKSKMPILGHYTWQLMEWGYSPNKHLVFIYPHNDKLGIKNLNE